MLLALLNLEQVVGIVYRLIKALRFFLVVPWRPSLVKAEHFEECRPTLLLASFTILFIVKLHVRIGLTYHLVLHLHLPFKFPN